MILYKHEKTGSLYEFLFKGLLESNLSSVVVYRGIASGVVWVRPAEEFFDGRFQVVVDAGEVLKKEIEAAIPVMKEYARKNPKFKCNEVVQDPNGVHAWLERNDPEQQK